MMNIEKLAIDHGIDHAGFGDRVGTTGKYFCTIEQLEAFAKAYADNQEMYLLKVLADIRQAMGNADKLMLDELAPAIAKACALQSSEPVAIEALKDALEKAAKLCGPGMLAVRNTPNDGGKRLSKANPLDRFVMPDVLDACCGTRMMWMEKYDERAVFVDKRTESFSIAPGRAYKNGAVLNVAPDQEADFTALPFDNETFHHVVFDPPHHTSKRLGKTGTGVMEKKYGRLGDDWREMLADGFSECFRVLKPKGTLIFKWCETEIPLSEILKLTPEKPLYGHKSGKKAQTHWVAFLKA